MKLSLIQLIFLSTALATPLSNLARSVIAPAAPDLSEAPERHPGHGPFHPAPNGTHWHEHHPPPCGGGVEGGEGEPSPSPFWGPEGGEGGGEGEGGFGGHHYHHGGFGGDPEPEFGDGPDGLGGDDDGWGGWGDDGWGDDGFGDEGEDGFPWFGRHD